MKNRKMKKLISLILVCAVVLALFAACAKKETKPEEPEEEKEAHVHTPDGLWLSDANTHWSMCECGKMAEEAAHSLENDVCTVCGSEIIVYDDGTKQFTAFNEQGDITVFVIYDADGNISSEEKTDYEYDADGNTTGIKVYRNGELSDEYEVSVNAAGEEYYTKESHYYEDGTSSISEFDESGRFLRAVWFNAGGIAEYDRHYSYSADGMKMSEKEYAYDVLSYEREYMFDETGLQKLLKDITYSEDGSSIRTEYNEYEHETLIVYYDANGNTELETKFENEYDEAGNRLSKKTYENGALIEEMWFAFGSDDTGSWSMSTKIIYYHADGAKTVTENDPAGLWATETEIDAEGNTVHELRYEYEYDESGNHIGSKEYENGKLLAETDIILGPDGETDAILQTAYHEGGGKTVSEYDGYFYLIKETVYDAGGKVVG